MSNEERLTRSRGFPMMEKNVQTLLREQHIETVLQRKFVE